MTRVAGGAALAGAVLLGCAAVFGIPSDVERTTEAGVVVVDASVVDTGKDVSPPPPACDPAAELGPAIPVLATAEVEANARLGADELEIYFEALRAPTTTKNHLLRASRASRDGTFGATTPVFADLDGPDTRESSPSITADGRSLFFLRESTNGSVDLIRATRNGTGFDFPVILTLTNAGRAIRDPFVRGNGEQIWFAARETDTSDLDLVVASRVSDTTYDATPAGANLATPDTETAPVLTPDGLTIFFASDRRTHRFTEKGENLDVWTAKRSLATLAFEEAKVVPVASESGVAETPSWVSADGCRLYFTRGEKDIFVAARGR
ncbi:MAG: hypothetical protein U0270_35900 [Labilithrix sp.]